MASLFGIFGYTNAVALATFSETQSSELSMQICYILLMLCFIFFSFDLPVTVFLKTMTFLYKEVMLLLSQPVNTDKRKFQGFQT